MIEVKNLTKWYGNHLAVSDISFTIEPGHIYGFLGPNGAGKSTIMNIMTGCLAATEGQVKINGYDIFEDSMEAKKQIGYLPEMPPLYLSQTPEEYLYFVASAKKIKKEDREKEINKVIAETHIEAVTGRLIKEMSKGYRQRVGIAQALLGNPEVIILDEPTVGLDPMQIIEIRDLIRELGENHTVILSSHILSEVEAICQEVLIIYEGKMVAFDKPEKLQSTLSGDSSIELVCQSLKGTVHRLPEEIKGIREIRLKEPEEDKSNDTEEVPESDESDDTEKTREWILKVDSGKVKNISKEIIFALAREKIPVYKMNPIKADLENIFIELTRGKGPDPVQKSESDAGSKSGNPDGEVSQTNHELLEEDL